MIPDTRERPIHEDCGVVYAFDDRLNRADAVNYFLGRLNAVNPTVGAVIVRRTSAPFDGIVGQYEVAARVIPRLHQRLWRVPGDVVPPRWVNDHDFRLDRHVRHASVSGDAGALGRVLDEEQNAQFDLDHPLWRVTHVSGLPSGRSATVFVFHHALSDGMGMAAALGSIVVPEVADEDRASKLVVERPSAPPTVSEVLRERGRALGDVRAAWRSKAGAADGDGRRRRRPWAWGRRSGPATSIRHATCYRVPLDTWRAASHHRGGGVNELLVGLAISSLVLYAGADRPGDVRVAMPVNRRGRAGEQGGGNELDVAIAYVPASDAHQRLGSIRECLVEARNQAGDGGVLLDAALAMLPGGLQAKALLRSFRRTHLMVSSLRLPVDASSADPSVEAIYVLPATTGNPVSFALSTFGDMAFLTTNVDVGVVSDPGRFDATVRRVLTQTFGSTWMSMGEQP